MRVLLPGKVRCSRADNLEEVHLNFCQPAISNPSPALGTRSRDDGSIISLGVTAYTSPGPIDRTAESELKSSGHNIFLL